MNGALVEKDGVMRGGVVSRCVLMAVLCVAGVQFYSGSVYCLRLVLSASWPPGHAAGVVVLAAVGVGEGLLSAAVFLVLVRFLRRAARSWGRKLWFVRLIVYGLSAAIMVYEYLYGALVGLHFTGYVTAIAVLATLVAGIEYFNTAVIEAGPGQSAVESDGELSEQGGGDRVEA
jgi:hypothetical protein